MYAEQESAGALVNMGEHSRYTRSGNGPFIFQTYVSQTSPKRVSDVNGRAKK